jgi:hypothetical protein
MNLIAAVCSAKELIDALKQVPEDATIEVRSIEYYDGAEVWYEELTNTVILK